MLDKWQKLFVYPEETSAQQEGGSECSDYDAVECLEVFETLHALYKEVARRYTNMSFASFRKEYMRKINVKKKDAHHKHIKITSNKSV